MHDEETMPASADALLSVVEANRAALLRLADEEASLGQRRRDISDWLAKAEAALVRLTKPFKHCRFRASSGDLYYSANSIGPSAKADLCAAIGSKFSERSFYRVALAEPGTDRVLARVAWGIGTDRVQVEVGQALTPRNLQLLRDAYGVDLPVVDELQARRDELAAELEKVDAELEVYQDDVVAS